nr:MAG: hypothetical protein DIU55_12920 [Bacillota bacterium]
MTEGASLDRAVEALQRLLADPQASPEPPPELEGHAGFAALYRDLSALRTHLTHICRGDLSHPIRERGPLAGCLKSLQARLRHLTWQVQQVAAGDFSQRVEDLGEFSAAFNRMTEALARARAELERSEARYRLLAENVADVIATLDGEGRFVYVSPSARSLLGCAPEELTGRLLSAITGCDALPRPGTVVELTVRRPDGSTRWVEVSTGALPAGGLDGAVLVCVFRDITERKQLEDDLKQAATTDELTGAHNRRFFVQICEQELLRAGRRSRPTSLVLMDVDHFKRINDRYGHAAGDEVLRRVVEAGRRTLRSEDVIGRIGGDEFAVLLPSTTLEQAVRVAERLRATCEQLAVETRSGTIRFTMSCGVVEWKPHYGSVEGLLQRADSALYAAKNAGRNCVRTDEASPGRDQQDPQE